MTEDGRYSLSETSKNIIKKVDTTLYIDVLIKDKLPTEFRRLKIETEQILEEISNENPLIKFNFVNPLENYPSTEQGVSQLQKLGLKPLRKTQQEQTGISQIILFPWALANLGKRTIKIPLLKYKIGVSIEERINKSIQVLEYNILSAIANLTTPKKKKIAVLKGHRELPNILIADLIANLQEQYDVRPYKMHSKEDANRTLDSLKKYDLALLLKPQKAFSDSEKYILDQYIMNGGKALLTLEKTTAELDSLYGNGLTLAFPKNLNLDDMLFKYGVRINPKIIKDLYFTQIVIASGYGSKTDYIAVPWVYAPMIISSNNHAINNNIEPIRMTFVSPIDTLKNTLKKTILLSSSALSKTVGTPTTIDIESIKSKPDKTSFNEGHIPVAVLIEGKFNSVYKNRVKPFKTSSKDKSSDTKIIVISDGDLVKNQTKNACSKSNTETPKSNTEKPRIPLKSLEEVDGADYVSGKWKPKGKELYHIKVNDETIREVVYKEVKRLGLEADLYHIDVSGVTNMSHMFAMLTDKALRIMEKKEKKHNYLAQFNGDLSAWDVSNVTNMMAMFSRSHFNGNISKWNVSKVTYMSERQKKEKEIRDINRGKYTYLGLFNGDLSGWDVSNVKNMEGMFACSDFNGDISKWNVSKVENMVGMFHFSEFNGNISKWKVSKVENMSEMFSGSKFNGDISTWNVSEVTNMNGMFEGSEFNGDISGWKVSKVEDMSSMFSFSKFNSDISNWDIHSVTNMSSMFTLSKFNGDISNWDVYNVTNMGSMFSLSEFNGDISKWEVSKVTNMSEMFAGSKFNGDLSKWTVSKVKNMSEMFKSRIFTKGQARLFNLPKNEYPTSFNRGKELKDWDVSNVTNMKDMFDYDAPKPSWYT
ncbi:gliding-associated ABC transporter substrate-binding protein GldG [Elysia marginata]|uniref:Gliding-associated ABC transporter substrate-binding protein GldG n=1 Tax=Elysia marginata TaxID=1093978 RepID=A0AAV4G6B2_9GAST|nr:gliding-associated ABC transporter substrate-binding protein GldG [Elysia marginata]